MCVQSRTMDTLMSEARLSFHTKTLRAFEADMKTLFHRRMEATQELRTICIHPNIIRLPHRAPKPVVPSKSRVQSKTRVAVCAVMLLSRILLHYENTSQLRTQVRFLAHFRLPAAPVHLVPRMNGSAI